MQPDLPLAPETPTVAWLEQHLLTTGRWVTSARLCQALGASVSENTKRILRHLASQSDCIISGDHGYAHVACVPPDQISHWIARQRSQINATGRRILRVRHHCHTHHGMTL